MMFWHFFNGATPDHLGFLPQFVAESDPRPAKEQFDKNYAHGGGWRKFDGFKMGQGYRSITYPGDPPFRVMASTMLREEKILVFEGGPWVCVLQPDGTYEIARMD